MAVTFLSARPHLEVLNVVESIAFYKAAFGFEVVMMTEEEIPSQAIVGVGSVMLTFIRAVAPRTLTIAACFIDVEGIDELYERCLASGHEVKSPPTDRPWGIRDLVVIDPDGHLIAFGERIA